MSTSTRAGRPTSCAADLSGITPAILAGGLGTRLRPALGDHPKVLAAVDGRPFVAYLLDVLAAASLPRVILLTGHGGAQVEKTLGRRHAGLELVYSPEPAPLGTAGALRAALPLISTPTILLLNGDSHCPVDLAAFAQRHRRERADASLVLAWVEEAGRFGQVERSLGGRVTRFTEKRGHGPGWINAGIYLIERLLIEAESGQAPLSLERELLPRWARDRRVFGHAASGPFLDIGTPESYAAAGTFLHSLGQEKSGRRP